MLSPATHEAAVAHAKRLTNDHSEAALLPLVDAFETGVVYGNRLRLERFPLNGDQQFKRLLGAYIGENVLVYHPFSNRYGILRGLPACYSKDGEPFAEVEFFCDAEAREEASGDLTEDVNKLLLCLYSFGDLDKWVLDQNGQNTLVMEELIASLYAGPVDVFKTSYHSAKSATGKLLEWWVIDFATHEGTGCEATFRSDGAGEIESRPVNAAPLLQQYHFAVGFQPHQYHRRQPGFDYTSGGKPPKACEKACAGCQQGREVGCA